MLVVLSVSHAHTKLMQARCINQKIEISCRFEFPCLSDMVE